MVTIQQADDRYQVVTDDMVVDSDVVIMATPPLATARILGQLAPLASAALGSVTMTSSVVLQFDAVRNDSSSMESFHSGGWLGAPEENPVIAAGSFVGHKWPHLYCPDRIRAIIRRADLLRMDDDALIAQAIPELEHLLNVRTRRDTLQLHRWESSLPMRQLETAEQIDRAKASLPPSLHLAGIAETVVGVSAAFAAGQRVASSVLAATAPVGQAAFLTACRRSDRLTTTARAASGKNMARAPITTKSIPVTSRVVV